MNEDIFGVIHGNFNPRYTSTNVVDAIAVESAGPVRNLFGSEVLFKSSVVA